MVTQRSPAMDKAGPFFVCWPKKRKSPERERKHPTFRGSSTLYSIKRVGGECSFSIRAPIRRRGRDKWTGRVDLR